MTPFLVAGQSRYQPKPLVLAAPIQTWDEGLPIGNGLMGALMWGSGNHINLSLDRGDLWDLRVAPGTRTKDWNYQTVQRLVASKNQSELVRLFDAPYDNIAYPTKIPAGRVEIETDGRPIDSFDLDLAKGEATARSDQKKISAIIAAEKAVLMFRTTGKVSLKLVRPESLKQLGYSLAPVVAQGEGFSFLQEGALGFKYAVVVDRKGLDGAVAIVTNSESADPLQEARKRVAEALAKGYDAVAKESFQWWNRFWNTSAVHVPDAKIQGHYDFVKYLYGAGSRPGAPPIPLQGVWTADAGSLPPWKGDYHNDLNTQMTYCAYQTAGLFESGRSFLDFNWNLLPEYRKFAQGFFGVPGALVPGVMTLKGEPMGGWGMYSLSPTNGAWIAHLFYRHWRVTQDSAFLRSRAYPWCKEVGTALKSLLKQGPDGYLQLPLSSSPEIHDNSLQAWLQPNSNYDQMQLVEIFEDLAEMAESLRLPQEAKDWRALRGKLAPYVVDPATHSLMFAKGEPYRESHRHFSHVMAIYPFGKLNALNGDKAVEPSIRLLDQTGTAWWCGYSFSWMSAMCARNGLSDLAAKYLDDYIDAFILRNGFHANGDQKKRGLSNFTYRPVTLEGNFQAMEAVHEMLLQSWGGTISVFPAVRSSWKDVSFESLRADGGFKVWANRVAGRATYLRVQATVGHELAILDPFEGRGKWTVKPKKVGRALLFKLQPGAEVIGRL